MRGAPGVEVRGALCGLLVAALLAGCSSLRPYPTAAGGNLAVRAEMDGTARAVLHIHRVDARCRTDYRGTVALDRPAVSLALPPGEPSYVVVIFDTSSFFAGKRSTSVGTLLTPRAGASYELAARYRDGIYGVALFESAGRGRRPLARRDLDACRSGG